MTILGMKESKLALFGGLAGIGTAWVLGLISKLLSAIPGLTVDLQAITVTGTGLAKTIGTGLGTYAQKLFTTVGIGIPEMAFAFVGGALFVLLGAFLVEKIGFLSGLAKGRQARLTTILVVAGIASGWILSMTISIPAISAIIIMAVNAFVLSYILVLLDDFVFKPVLKTSIVP